MNLQAAIDALIDEYLAAGCPCRFPRFRSFVKMDTSKATGGSFTTPEQTWLIAAFEAKVPLVDKAPLGPYEEVLPGMWKARCAKCGSGVARSSNEFAPGGWIDYLVFERAKGLIELGARVEKGLVLRASGFREVAPAMGGMKKAAELWPCVGAERFVEWLRERAEVIAPG